MIYLDHAATTPVLPCALEAMQEWLDPEKVGNPGSIHSSGKAAKRAIENAREQVAALINADPDEIFFTSGATESNNGFIHFLPHQRVLTTEFEHESILAPTAKNCVKVKPTPEGYVTAQMIEQNLGSSFGGVSVMWVNNEIGTVQPIEEIAELCEAKGVLFHTDATQAVGHIPVDVKQCKVDMLTMGGHKFGAPIGVGALYVSRSAQKKVSLMYGGGQENGVRPGTENVAGIVAMGAAASFRKNRLPFLRTADLINRDYFLKELERMLPMQFTVNGATVGTGIVSLTFPGIESESLMMFLDRDGVRVSAGSACSAKTNFPSHVLTAIGLPYELASSTIRVSFGWDTTINKVMSAADAIAKCVGQIKSL